MEKWVRRWFDRGLDLVFLVRQVQNYKEIIQAKGSDRYVVWRLRNGSQFCARIGSSDTLAIREIILRNILPVTRDHYGVVVDIGAHIGTFSARVASLANRVVAFEPTRRNYHLLKEYCKSKKNNIEKYKLAVTGDGRDVAINIHPENTGQHSIFAHEIPNKDVEHVPSIASGDLLTFIGSTHIDLLKIDAEGAEHEIIQQAESVLPNTSEIIVEVNDIGCPDAQAQLVARLKAQGFATQLRPTGSNACILHAVNGSFAN